MKGNRVFRKGDKVRYKSNTNAPDWEGFEGVVTEDQAFSHNPVNVMAANGGEHWDVSQNCVLRQYNLELIPERRFKVGDPVQAAKSGRRPYLGHSERDDLVVLTLTYNGYGVGPEGNDPELDHNAENGWLTYLEDELEARKVPAQEWEDISFEDIKQGDRIRWTYSQYGVAYTREGDADIAYSPTIWSTNEGNFVVENHEYYAGTRIERLAVPKPPLWAALAEVGTHGYTLGEGKINRVLTKTAEDEWSVYYPLENETTTLCNSTVAYFENSFTKVQHSQPVAVPF